MDQLKTMDQLNELEWAKVFEVAEQDFYQTKFIHVDMVGDRNAGDLLARIVYWFSPSKDGRSKLRIFKNNKFWLAKARTDWWDEIRLSAKQYDTAIKKLVELRLVEVWNTMFDGKKTPHIHLNWDTYLILKQQVAYQIYQEKVQAELKRQQEEYAEFLAQQQANPALSLDFTQTVKPVDPLSPSGFTHEEYPVLPKGHFRFYPNGKTENAQTVKPITKTTSKTTSKTILKTTTSNDPETISSSSRDSIDQELKGKYPNAPFDVVKTEMFADKKAITKTDKQYRALLDYRLKNWQPEQKKSGGKQSTRKEQLPEWLEEQKQQSQETQIEAVDLEEERRRLEEELKMYKKA
jgi:hypothetical protein